MLAAQFDGGTKCPRGPPHGQKVPVSEDVMKKIVPYKLDCSGSTELDLEVYQPCSAGR
jgi:hypothetical protein